MNNQVCRDCGSLNIEYRPEPWEPWWDELVEAAEWPPDEKRDAKLLAWAAQYEVNILDAATDSFIARNHRIAKNRYDDPRRGWMTYVRNEYKWQPQGAVRPRQGGRNETKLQRQTSRY